MKAAFSITHRKKVLIAQSNDQSIEPLSVAPAGEGVPTSNGTLGGKSDDNREKVIQPSRLVSLPSGSLSSLAKERRAPVPSAVPLPSTPSLSTVNASDDRTTATLTPSERRHRAPLRFLRRVMRSKSDSLIRITPVSRTASVGGQGPSVSLSCEILSGMEEGRGMNEDCERGLELEEDVHSTVEREVGAQKLYPGAQLLHTPNSSSLQTIEYKSHGENAYLCGIKEVNDNVAIASDVGHAQDGVGVSKEGTETTTSLGNSFLNASLQLLQTQSETKQNVRRLWAAMQHLHANQEISDAALDTLHGKLVNIMKSLAIETMEGVRHLKTGYLTLVDAPASVLAPPANRNPASATRALLFGNTISNPNTATVNQQVWVTLSEEQCRLELAPPTASSPIGKSTSASSPIGQFKLPPSISWLLSDPATHSSQQQEPKAVNPTTIKLQGCHVRHVRCPVNNTENGIKGNNVCDTKPRFQVLVPTHEVQELTGSSCSPTPSHAMRFSVFTFEVNASAECEEFQRQQHAAEWVQAVDRVCMQHLYALERQLAAAHYMLPFCELLDQHFPVTVPLTWLRNRLERIPMASHSSTSFPSASSSLPTANMALGMTVHERAMYHQQQIQRRSSRNLSMVQVIKDLERDEVLVDHKLLVTNSTSRNTASANNLKSASAASNEDKSNASVTSNVRQNSVTEIVQYLVAKAIAFTQIRPIVAPAASNSSAAPSRQVKHTEATILAFVERVLRGSSRTQSGGDIYDAISFFCHHRHISVCPVSQDAFPVQLNVIAPRQSGTNGPDDGDAVFHVEIQVTMQFKLVELMEETSFCAMSTTPREWAVIEGVLSRRFTLGRVSEPGTITLKYIPNADNTGDSNVGCLDIPSE